MERQSRFPDWTTLYEREPVEKMAWYCEELDPDLAFELNQRHLSQGRFIDIGTGPATQAMELHRKGFRVTGTDLSKAAIERGKKLFRDVEFVQDDIVNSKLRGQWDYAFDRGCFHCLDPKDRPRYVETVAGILHPGAFLFLKTFSWKESDWGYGPWRFAPQDIEDLFSRYFSLVSSKETVYQGALPKNPLALFCTLERKA